VQEVIAYIHHHPLRVIAILVVIFAVLVTLFFVLKKGMKKWLTLGLLVVFIPLAFRIVKMTPLKRLNFLQETSIIKENTELSSFEKNGVKTFGIDISHHQGAVNWDSLITSKHPIQFVIIRATYGSTTLDREFHRNWNESSGKSYIRGVYHYYLPDQSSASQFELFKSHVYLKKGDLPPVLDIEENSSLGRENLLKGVKNWLRLAEQHYRIKPIIYANLDFYLRYFNTPDFKKYHFWIAAYAGHRRVNNIPWTFLQFSKKMRVKGTNEYVDGNDFNGNREELDKLTIH
jgi:lysozyme